MKQYEPRLADKTLRELLAVGAVLIEGPKWCGKTWTAEELAQSALFMNDPEKQEQNVALATNSPSIALEGKTPRLIDEWQLVPKLWDAIRFEIDRRDKSGQFILTGSAVPADMSETHHSGTGRIARLLMRPMSLYESHESTGEISLSELFSTPSIIKGESTLGLRDIASLSCRGGWPKAVKAPKKDGLVLARAYFDGLINSDVARVDNVKRDRNIARRILRSYARNIGQQVSLEQIRKDTESGDGMSVSIDTIYNYIAAFRRIYVLEDSSSWNPNLRSKSAIRTTDTRYFVDPSIAIQALGIEPEDLIGDLKTFGFIFENLAVRDLRIYAETNGGFISHYRDSSNLECDAIIHARNGKYGLAEIKLGSDESTLNDAASTLMSLSNIIDTEQMRAPSFLMILCGNCPYAYRREDGIYVVPIGCLKP